MTCIVEDCKFPKVYGYYSQGVPLFCFKHAFLETVYLLNGKCIEQGCTADATYKFKYGDILYCGLHSLTGMVPMGTPLCIEEECVNRAIFGPNMYKSYIYCDKHKKPGMTCYNSGDCRHPGCYRKVSELYVSNYCYLHKS